MSFTSVELYVFGKPRVPPWVGDAMSDVEYNSKGELVGAVILTANGIKAVKQGDVLIRANKENASIVILGQKDAKKYGVTK